MKNLYKKYELVEELIYLAKLDQEIIMREFPRIEKINDKTKQQRLYKNIAKGAHIRAQRMLDILEIIKNPSIDTIGQEASEAILLITQHSYLECMKKVLSIYLDLYEKNHKSVPAHYLPSLIDRIEIIENKQQIYGTQWMLDNNGVPFLIYVTDFINANKKRKKFGLDPIRKPHNLASKTNPYPLGLGLAKSEDMRQLSIDDYQKYTEYYKKALI